MKINQENELIQQLFVKVIQENNEKSGNNIIEYQITQNIFLTYNWCTVYFKNLYIVEVYLKKYTKGGIPMARAYSTLVVLV